VTGKQREFIEQILLVAQEHIPNLHVSETSCACGWQAPFTIASEIWPRQWADHVFRMIEQKGLPCLSKTTKNHSNASSEAPIPVSSESSTGLPAPDSSTQPTGSCSDADLTTVPLPDGVTNAPR
jgi:hypothetical protein